MASHIISLVSSFKEHLSSSNETVDKVVSSLKPLEQLAFLFDRELIDPISTLMSELLILAQELSLSEVIDGCLSTLSNFHKNITSNSSG